MDEAPPPGLAGALRGLLGAGVGSLQTRLQLFGLELREEKLRAAGFLFNTVLAALFLGFALVFLAILLTVLWWDSHRLLALALGAAVFATAGILCATRASRELARSSTLFSASLAELDRDRESLQHRP